MKRLLSILLAVLMLAVMLPVTALAEDRAALKTIIVNEDGYYDANSAHVAYTYYTDKMCYPSSDTTTPGATPGGTIRWVKTVTITGIQFDELTDSSADMKLLQQIIINGRRTDESHQFQDSIEVKFVNCSFNQTTSHLQVYKIYPCNVTKYTFRNCEFNQKADGQFALTLNASETALDKRPISYEITGCTINAVARGINIISGTEEQAIGPKLPTINISNNIITIADTSKEKNTAFQIAGNWDGSNITATSNELIRISDNTITAYAAVRVNSTLSDSAKYIVKFDNNTLKGNTKKTVLDGESETVAEIGKIYEEQFTPAPIIIYTPTDDTPNTTTGNPTTGANDMVAAAAALMAVSVLGIAVLSRKK